MTIAQSADVTAAYPLLSAAQLSDLPSALAAASALCQRFVGGYTLAQATFDEEYTPGTTRIVKLRHWPVASIQAVQTDLSQWLLASATGFVRATATLATTGDIGSFVPTGITLASTGAGGAQVTTAIPFSSNITVASLAPAIAAVTGWTATVQPGCGGFLSSDIRPIQGPGGALITPTPFWGYTTDLPFDQWDVKWQTGRVFMATYRPDPYSFPDRTWGSDPRPAKVRFAYTAGFVTPPPDAVRACVLTVKHIFDSEQFSSVLRSLKAGNVQWERAEGLLALPEVAKSILDQFRSKRIM